jgi:hypothetical protein
MTHFDTAGGRLTILPGQTHEINPDAIAPVMAAFSSAKLSRLTITVMLGELLHRVRADQAVGRQRLPFHRGGWPTGRSRKLTALRPTWAQETGEARNNLSARL